MALVTLAPAGAGIAAAAAPPSNVVITTGQVTLGVSSDAGLDEAGTGMQ